jgi:hypothetical protein
MGRVCCFVFYGEFGSSSKRMQAAQAAHSVHARRAQRYIIARQQPAHGQHAATRKRCIPITKHTPAARNSWKAIRAANKAVAAAAGEGSTRRNLLKSSTSLFICCLCCCRCCWRCSGNATRSPCSTKSPIFFVCCCFLGYSKDIAMYIYVIELCLLCARVFLC